MGLRTTNWEQIRRYKENSTKGDLYMAEHPLSHDDAVAQSQMLKRQKGNQGGIKMYNVYKPNSEEGYPIASFDTMREAEECAEYYEERWGYDMTIKEE